jgi:hypothetical protein
VVAIGLEVGFDSVGQMEHSVQVDFEDSIPILASEGFEGRSPGHARIVNQDIQRAPPLSSTASRAHSWATDTSAGRASQCPRNESSAAVRRHASALRE